MAKVPPGDAGHPVCLDTSTEIRLQLLRIVAFVLKHSPYRSLTPSASDELCVRSPNTRCVLRSAASMLPSVQALKCNTILCNCNKLLFHGIVLLTDQSGLR
jgi:hypothetical protein